jgi:CRP-like cAMP-binding protein
MNAEPSQLTTSYRSTNEAKFLAKLYRSRRLHPSDKLIASVLLGTTNERGLAHLSHTEIVSATGLCDKTVRSSIPRLEAHGWFAVDRDLMRTHGYRPCWQRAGVTP